MSSSLLPNTSRVPDLDGPWRRTAAFAGLLGPDGRLSSTIFAEMTALAREYDAVNLGQGFPDEDGPREVLEAAKAAIDRGVNQYPPGRGDPDLLAAISEHQRRFYGFEADPHTEIIVTAGVRPGRARRGLPFVVAIHLLQA